MRTTMKYIVLLLLLAVFQTVGEAQAVRKQENRSVYVGVKGGLNLPRMLYFQNVALGQIKPETLLEPIGGAFVDIPLGGFVSVAPEAMFVQRGCGLKYSHFSGADVAYQMDLRYVDLRFPVEARWAIRPWLQPYIALGVEAGYCLGGTIHMDRTTPLAFDQTIDVGKANLNPIHAGAFAGLGIRSVFEVGKRDLLLKLCATYHQGMVDTYSAMEKDGTAIPENVNAYQITGRRLPQGLELTLGIGISLDKRDDACATFSNDPYRRKGSRGRLFGF